MSVFQCGSNVALLFFPRVRATTPRVLSLRIPLSHADHPHTAPHPSPWQLLIVAAAKLIAGAIHFSSCLESAPANVGHGKIRGVKAGPVFSPLTHSSPSLTCFNLLFLHNSREKNVYFRKHRQSLAAARFFYLGQKKLSGNSGGKVAENQTVLWVKHWLSGLIWTWPFLFCFLTCFFLKNILSQFVLWCKVPG